MYRSLRLAALLIAFSGAAGMAVAQTSPAPSSASKDDPVVATVNGDKILRSEVIQYHQSLPPQFAQLPINMLFNDLLTAVIDRRVVVQTARKSGMVNDAEVKRRLAALEDDVLQEVFLTRKIEAAITPERLRASYEAMVKAIPPREEVHARHILVDTEDAAKKLIEELNKGADFEKLAKERSKGPSANTGGDLGYFVREQMVPEFSQVAFNLEPGKISAPVQTKFGWHVIKVEDKRSSGAPSFEESEQELRMNESRTVVTGVLEDLRKGAKIERVASEVPPMPKLGDSLKKN